MILGADIYHGDYPLDFHAIAAGGIKFIWHKATQGINMVDAYYPDGRARAKVVGIPFGGYHFFTAADPIQQAQHFVNYARPAPGDLIPWLDVETPFEGVGAAALACALEIKALTGHCPVIYCSESFWAEYLAAHFDADWAKCIARYPGPPETSCQFHQFSETGQVAGIDHALDLDHCLADDLTPFLIP